MSLTSQQDCKDLQTALLNLAASGPQGFEGLIRDAYREATGISLRLQKSGAQHGADAVTGDLDGDVATAIEAKRYRSETSLPLDELKNKLIDAATRPANPVELWILAASREIAGDDVAELRRIGDEQGIGVLVLDWRSAGDSTAPLPLLLTLAPNTVRQHLGDGIADILPTLAKQPEYDAQKNILLKQLACPDLGLAHAAKAVKEKISDTLRSCANAKDQLQNSVDMEAPSRIWAPRDEWCKAIQKWKTDATLTPICVAVGEEGTGKTWLMFDWWRRETGDDDPPLIVWLAARDVASGSITDAIGAALTKWISAPKRSETFWARRVELWRRIHGPGSDMPFIWLMLDGVNEGTSQENVMKLLNNALASDWKGNVGVLLSDRPAHWKQRFNSGKSLENPPHTIEIAQFSETELIKLLACYGKAKSDFSPEVLEIIRSPRWFAVAAELFGKEHDWSAHSPEQLMLRYWQQLLKERGQITAINDDIFRDFIAQLGAEMKANWGTDKKVSKAQLKELFACFSDAPDKDILSAVDDVTSGIWLSQNDVRHFDINSAILPCAIGLALLNELRSSATVEEAESECEKFLGPIENQDVGVDILGAAVSMALVGSEVHDNAKTALMKRWVNSHNFRTVDLQLLWRIAEASPDVLFSVAELIWLRKASGHSIDEILVKCIVNVGVNGDRVLDVINFLSKWAGTYWPDPKEGQFIGYNPTNEESAAAAIATEKRLEKLQADLGDTTFAGTGLCCYADGAGASWLTHRVFAIATYLPRFVQKSVWCGWVLSRAVMGTPRHFDDLAWSLRINPIDGLAAAQALMETVDELLSLQSKHVRHWTISLLDAHGGPEAAKKLSAIGGSFQTRRCFDLDGEAKLADGIVEIPDDKNKSDRCTVRVLSDFASNPRVQISDSHRARLERYAEIFPINEIFKGRSQTSADIDLQGAEPALARWAPEALHDLYRRCLSTIGNRDDSGVPGLTLALDELLVLLSDEIQQKISTVLFERVLTNKTGKLDRICRSLCFAAVFDRKATEQHAVWKQIGPPETVPEQLKHLVRPIPMGLLRKLELELNPDHEKERIVGWLCYLDSSDTTKWPKNWKALSKLFDHVDVGVRSLAFKIAVRAEDIDLARQLYDSKWKGSLCSDVSESYWGSCLLSLAATPETFEAIGKRIDPQWSEAPWQRFKYKSEFKRPFRDFLTDSVELECAPPTKQTFPNYQCSPTEATRKLLEQDREVVTALADRLFDLENVRGYQAERWPRNEILRAFFELDPQQAVKYWRKLVEHKYSRMDKSENFDVLPFLPENGDEIDDLRDILIKQAENDWMLMTLATAIERYERVDWAVGWIKKTLEQPQCPADIARALTLAGLLDDSDTARELWSRELSRTPCGGWIEIVYAQAKQRIEMAWHSLHWFDKMLSADKDEEFFAFWRLFVLSADLRLMPIAQRRYEQRRASMAPRYVDFLEFNWTSVVRQTRKAEKKMEKNLFSFRTGLRWAMPWAN